MRTATPHVQLIGYSVFAPPIDIHGWDVFTPDSGNRIDDHAGDTSLYDSQALVEFAGRSCYESYHRPRPETATNAGYLANVMSQKHFSVLEHSLVTFYITGVSRACTHELVRHRHLSPSQLSQRFVDGSSANMVIPPLLQEHLDTETPYGAGTIGEVLTMAQGNADHMYESIVSALEARGVKGKPAREAARAVLPNFTETKIVLSGNFRAWIEFLVKRDSSHADAEIRAVARKIGTLLADHAPNVFGAEARKIWQPDE